MISNHNGIKLKTDKRKISVKFSNTWKLYNILINTSYRGSHKGSPPYRQGFLGNKTSYLNWVWE